MMASQRVGAGEGNRTLDIQLGKLDRSPTHQELSCKTAIFEPKSYQRVTVLSQNLGAIVGVRLPVSCICAQPQLGKRYVPLPAHCPCER
jgi:hypothetical protein